MNAAYDVTVITISLQVLLRMFKFLSTKLINKIKERVGLVSSHALKRVNINLSKSSTDKDHG